ncbi:3-keto-disaccharide hydrolase [Flagellimonas sp.]|uniref:3-keto-disaccharide hydrolase n=1 Tax=Flagellimonas sp. TaxID=2058762 RepID=UPI003F4A7525
MKTGTSVFIFLFVLVLNISCSDSHQLFQKNAKDWKSYGDAEWSFSNNTLMARVSDGDGFIMTDQSYRNFVLELEFKPDSTINSGIFVRCTKKELSATECHELNIWDLHPNQEYRTGAIVTKSVPLQRVETLNKWNAYKIKMEENRIQVWVNDTLTADAEYQYPEKGFIGLQAMGTGEIRFRNIRIRPAR